MMKFNSQIETAFDAFKSLFGGNRSGMTTMTASGPDVLPSPKVEIQQPRLYADSYGTVYTKTDKGQIIRVSAKGPRPNKANRRAA